VGYKSIRAPGFYLEDGTEINNTLAANLGILLRAPPWTTSRLRGRGPASWPRRICADTGEDIPFRPTYTTTNRVSGIHERLD
jgi:hypothetical protein